MEYHTHGINVSNFVDSYRNIGYSIETAIADVIDNSIFAKASIIDVYMIWEDFESGKPYVKIMDNGVGMSEDELIESMRLACKSPFEIRDSTDLGRFGLGLKSASFSQCNQLTVISKKDRFTPCCKRWDLDHIREVNEFELTYLTIDESGFSDSVPQTTGTCVIWTDLDMLSISKDSTAEQKKKYWNQIKERVYNHLALTFGSFKNKILFRFNELEIDLWDPFLSADPNTDIISQECIYCQGKQVNVSCYVIPYNPEAPYDLIQNESQTLNDLQGFYIYRNNRLIVASSWLGLPKLTKKEAYRLARIRIDIDNTMDNLWQIDIKKENAICPPEIQEYLQSYALLTRRASSSKFSSKGKTLRRNGAEEDRSFLWDFGIKNKLPCYWINRKNPIIESFKVSLQTTNQKRSFEAILKLIENHIPIMSILEQESQYNGEYIANNTGEVNEEMIRALFMEAVSSFLKENYSKEAAIQICRSTEPFISYVATIDQLIKEGDF